MRALPNMVVICPADEVETRQATSVIADWPGPVYMRLGRYPVPRLFDEGYRFQIGKAAILREGKDVAIFATGHMACKALDAADLLARDRIEAGVIDISTIKPLDGAVVREAAKDTGFLVSIEEHSIIGGLGSAIAECLTEIARPPRLLRLGVRDEFGESGLADELLEVHRLTGPLIADDIQRTIQ